MRQCICGDREYLTGYLGPWHEWGCDGDLWGYGEDMQLVRDVAIALNLLPSEPPYCKKDPELAIAHF